MEDVKEYMALQAERTRLKAAIKKLLGQDLSGLLQSFDSRLDNMLNDLGVSRQMTSSDFRRLIEDYTNELIRTGNLNLSFGRSELITLNNDVRKALDFKYPVDYKVLPAVHADSYQIQREFQSLLEKYREGRIPESVLRRSLKGRLHEPAGVINTMVNTQLAGFDNSASKTVANLAGLDEFAYMGPLGPHTRPFCNELLLNRQLYTEAQIQAMDNLQGLNVMRYCGGYNCMHFWTAVSRAWAETQKWLKAA